MTVTWPDLKISETQIWKRKEKFLRRFSETWIGHNQNSILNFNLNLLLLSTSVVSISFLNPCVFWNTTLNDTEHHIFVLTILLRTPLHTIDYANETKESSKRKWKNVMEQMVTKMEQGKKIVTALQQAQDDVKRAKTDRDIEI